MSESNKSKPFVGFVLLDSAKWNQQKFCNDLKNDWGYSYTIDDEKADIVTLELDGMTASVSFMPTPVPDREAEENAKANYIWSKAVEVAKNHKAHLMIAVINYGCTALEAAMFYTKFASVCLKQENATGIYTCGNVFSPHFYCNVADMMKQGELPVPDWVYFGLYRTEKGMCGYTYGLADFGYDEIEVLDTNAKPQELRDFMLDIAYYVISQNIVLKDGETIGFTPEQKLSITKSAGVALNRLTLKIEYPENY